LIRRRSNFLYNPATRKLGLIDFGAAREYRVDFVTEYFRLVYAAAEKDRDALIDASLKLGE
jgi:aarF domain-containing kinase